LVILVVLAACNARGARIDSRPVAPDLQSLRTLLESTTGEPARQYTTFDFGRARDERGVSVLVPHQLALELVSALRPRMPSGWVVFAGTDRWLGDEDNGENVELAIGPGTDQYDILRLARSDAVNYGMETEDLIRTLKTFEPAVELEILQANTDTIIALMHRLPADLAEFAETVYGFCPDIVDQGVGSLEALEAEMRRTKLLYLWWD
jgi:hypothetical protein